MKISYRFWSVVVDKRWIPVSEPKKLIPLDGDAQGKR